MAVRGRSTDPEAHRLYLQARHLLDRRTREDTAKGIGYLKEALALDAGYALAWAELCRAYAGEADRGYVPVAEGYGRARAAVERTFARYYDEFVKRRDGPQTWEAYTPYEFRVPGSLVRLGWRDRALEVLDWLFKDRRPPEWNQWPEVVWRDPRIPRFFGDLPHGWVASDFIRSVLDLFAYEDEQETGAALVIGAGVREEWLQEGDGVRVRRMPTRFGPVGYQMRAPGDTVVLTLDPGLRMPAAGIVIRHPKDLPAQRIVVDGRETSADANGDLVLLVLPREVRFEY